MVVSYCMRNLKLFEENMLYVQHVSRTKMGNVPLLFKT